MYPRNMISSQSFESRLEVEVEDRVGSKTAVASTDFVLEASGRTMGDA
jgi:hypothetical protein